MNEASQSCCSCRYYQSRELDPNSGEGQCRRHAPRPLREDLVTDADGYVLSHVFARWPDVSVDDWCGEWRPAAGVQP